MGDESMHAGEKRLGLPSVDGETGRQLRDRRVRLGMSVRQLAEEASVDRARLAALEAGDQNVRATTVGKVDATLSRLEAEMGVDEEPALVEELTFIVEGKDVTVTVRGPVTDREALKRDVADLIRTMRQGGASEPDED